MKGGVLCAVVEVFVADAGHAAVTDAADAVDNLGYTNY